MTLLQYARRKGWPVEGLEMDLAHSRVPVTEGEGASAVQKLVDRFEVKIRVRGGLDEEQRQRLAYIAARCPLKRTLERSPQFVETVEVVRG